MQREVISTCPVCESQLHVTRLHCNTCGTTIDGEFNVGRFARLGRDQMLLLEAFLRSRGNLRELERELGVSYPTVRGRVEALIRAIGLSDGTPLPHGSEPKTVEPQVDPQTRRAVLERLSRREITAEQAVAALRGEASAPDTETSAAAGQPADTKAPPAATNEDDNETQEE
ncbi:MAG TPA: DUF2089 domain-containing protein [Candidatus Limnocylindrales bacterium]|nr:DUF2089 domain-containing protein [Candidatus Limnocylindrales bacterium]